MMPRSGGRGGEEEQGGGNSSVDEEMQSLVPEALDHNHSYATACLPLCLALTRRQHTYHNPSSPSPAMSASLAPECNEVKEYVHHAIDCIWRVTLTTTQTIRQLLPEVVQREYARL